MKLRSSAFKQAYISLLLLTAIPVTVLCQFSPVPVSGFNHDVIAESGNSSLTTTTVSLDGVTVSNKVMYTQTFKTLNAFGGGGIPDNGVITSGADNYQLAPYTSNNALLIQRNLNGDMTINTPAKYDVIRILCFSTEGSSLVNATLFFTDGTQTTALTNYALDDWFNNTANLVLSGFGRCTRATPASGDDGYPTNPRMYYIEIPLSCTDKQKNLQKINFANVTTAGTNAPYPNVVIFAISGKAYSQNIVPTITNATCTSNGSASLSVTGSSSYSISWNTTPVQTGPVATNLPAGNYIATITDAASCVTTYPVTIIRDNNLAMAVHIDTSICFGNSFNANTISNAATYSWSPTTGVSDPTSPNPVLSPTVTTPYTVTGTTGSCTIQKTFTVQVSAAITLNVHVDTTICSGNSFNANTVSDATTFTWSPSTGVSDPSIASPILSPTTGNITISTTYTVTATTGVCSTSKTFIVVVKPQPTVFAGNDVNIIQGQSAQLQGSGGPGTYLWTSSTGSTSTLSATDILNPLATPVTTTTYYLQIISQQGCTGTDDVTVTVEPYCIKPMDAITPNGDGVNEYWLVSSGNCISNASVHVYNRYGTPVYENKDYRNDWSGTYKGKGLPDGTYYYVIEYTLLDQKKVIIKGDLTILR